MLAHLRRSTAVLRRLPIASLSASDPTPVYAGWNSRAETISLGSSWCSKHCARDFSTDGKITDGRRGYRQMELKPSTAVKDDGTIIDRIQKSTRGLKQGPVGHTLSSAEKRKFLINTLLDLEDSKEAVYSTLDAWVAFEQDFPLASIKQAIAALEKEEQWHRIVQVVKWMLSKGQGKTVKTYEQLVRALEKDNRAEEAHKIWEKKIGHDLHSVPWRFCGLMLAIYYRNNSLDRLIKLFHALEACGRRCPSKEYIRKVEDAYEMLGLLEEKKGLLEKYEDLYNKPSHSDRKKGRQFKKAEKKAGWYSKHGTRDFSIDDKITNGELKPSTAVEDNDEINDRIEKSTNKLKQGTVGRTSPSAEKGKILISTLLDLEDSKEAVYSTLDAWIASEQEFPLVSLKQAIVALEKKEQWHRNVQVITWMLSKGQGNSFGTYEQLVRALEKDNRTEEALENWEKKISHDLHSVPWSFCGLMLAIYYRNNRLDSLIKLFHDLEACGRKCPSREYVRRVEVAYKKLGLLKEKKGLLEKYKDLYNTPSVNDRKKFKKTEKKADEGTKHCKVETSEDLPINSCPSDKEPAASS